MIQAQQISDIRPLRLTKRLPYRAAIVDRHEGIACDRPQARQGVPQMHAQTIDAKVDLSHFRCAGNRPAMFIAARNHHPPIITLAKPADKLGAGHGRQPAAGQPRSVFVGEQAQLGGRLRAIITVRDR